MPADYFAEFIACSRANLKWHELWHWTSKDVAEITDAEHANGGTHLTPPPSSWVQRQFARLSALRSAHPAKFKRGRERDSDESDETAVVTEPHSADTLNESHGISMPSTASTSNSTSTCSGADWPEKS